MPAPQPSQPAPGHHPDPRKFGLVLLAVLVVVAAILTTAVTLSANGGTPTASATPAPATTVLLDQVKTFNETRNHVEGPVTYDQIPPVGGDHNPVWLNCGIYERPVHNENAVHSMEHGAVWITYNPAQVSPGDLNTLKGLAASTFIILSPYPGLPAPVVASAWNTQLTMTGADDPALAEFIRVYRQGPQTPEPGAPCTGGTDATIATDPALATTQA